MEAVLYFQRTQKKEAVPSEVLVINKYSSRPNGSESIAHEAELAVDSEAMRARGIIVLVKSN